MPRKQFEESPYDPIAADLAREVAAAGRVSTVSVVPVPRDVIASGQKPVEESKKLPRILPRNIEPVVIKRFQLTRKEEDDINAFLLRLQAQAATKVTFSVMIRAALHVMMQAEDQILREIGEKFPQDCPSTHDSVGMGEFEDRWSRCLTRALRKTPHPNLVNTTSF